MSVDSATDVLTNRHTRFFMTTLFFIPVSLLLQILLRCCFIHIAIIIFRHILYLVYLNPCLVLGLFMAYQCDLFFIFGLIFIVINHLNRCTCFFVHFLEYLLSWDDNVDEESE